MYKLDDLYFILNPSLGIIKIGIAGDVETRRGQIECGCGVPLHVLRVVVSGADMEKDLHSAFGPHRLLGEWFEPDEELVRLATGAADVRAFVRDKAPAIAEWNATREKRSAARREQQAEAAKAERAEVARLAAEQKRIAAEKKAAKKAGELKAAAKRRELDEQTRQEVAERRARPKVNRLAAPTDAMVIAARQQRFRNAAMLGVMPYETQRGASMGAPKDA